jgi:hypothetical protein
MQYINVYKNYSREQNQLLCLFVKRGITLTVTKKKLACHLLLLHTNSGYGNVLTAAFAHQGCSATE